jgi:hypothetical protein
MRSAWKTGLRTLPVTLAQRPAAQWDFTRMRRVASSGGGGRGLVLSDVLHNLRLQTAPELACCRPQ